VTSRSLCASANVLSTRESGYGGTLSAANTEDPVYVVLMPTAACCFLASLVSARNLWHKSILHNMSQSYLPKDFLWGFATARFVN
jgi:hypothetical protein